LTQLVLERETCTLERLQLKVSYKISDICSPFQLFISLIVLLSLFLFSISFTIPHEINHKLVPYFLSSEGKITKKLIECLNHYNIQINTEQNHLAKKSTHIIFVDKKEKQKKDYKNTTKKEHIKTTFLNKICLHSKVNELNHPCFLSHFHFATTNPNADRGCKNKFI